MLSATLQGRPVWCSMLFYVPTCVTWDWEHAFSRNNPSRTTQHYSLSLPLGGRNMSLLQHHEQERGSSALVQVWEVQESQERSMRVSQRSS